MVTNFHSSSLSFIFLIWVKIKPLISYYSGQREGLLTEATSEEVDQADPFYAHCKLHSDKILMK